MERIEVELHSTDPDSVEAMRGLLKQAPLNSTLEEADGKFFVVTANPGFLLFALANQGYVKRVIP